MDREFFKTTKKQEYQLSTGASIQLPVEYYDWTWIYAAFPAPVKNVEKILPSDKLKPILFLPGTALVQIGAFEYRQINGLAPYNELAVTIPVQYEPTSNYPGMPILHFPLFSPEKYSRLGVYVQRLPVTTREAFALGVEIWGYPKTVDEIVFTDTETHRRCILRCHDKETLSLEVRKLKTKFRQVSFHSYSVKDKKLVRTPIETQGEYGISRMPGGATLQLGTGPIADELRRLGMGRTAVGRIYATRLQSMLHAASEYLDI